MVAASIVVVGAGGHGIVLADAVLESGARLVGFTDVDPGKRGVTVLGAVVLGGDDALESLDRGAIQLVNGVGTAGTASQLATRMRVQARLEAGGWHFATVRHPRAVVSAHAEIGVGAAILAGAVVQAGAVIGDGAIVNAGAVVEHHTRVGRWVHVAPGAIICGDARVGDRVHVGAGAVIRQGASIGDDVILGAGAVVVRSIDRPGTYVGVPARRDEVAR